MFTGIVDHMGTISTLTVCADSCVFKIKSQFDALNLGESISVDGVCLTVIKTDNNFFECDISSETLSLTTLSRYAVGDSVNLERALCVGDRLGGHFVTGHVDMMAAVHTLKKQEDYTELQLSGFTSEQMAYLTPKGSVSVNGVSLTINTVDDNSKIISLMLIPHTLAMTNLQRLMAGSYVNIEFDSMAKMVAYQLSIYKKQRECVDV